MFKMDQRAKEFLIVESRKKCLSIIMKLQYVIHLELEVPTPNFFTPESLAYSRGGAFWL